MANKQPQSRYTVGQKIGHAFLIPDIALQMNLNSTIKKKKLQDLPESFAEFMRAFPRGGKVYPNSFEAINSKGEPRRFSIELISAACFYERGLKHDRSIVIPESYVQFANLDNFFPLYVSCERQPGSIWALALSPTSLWGKENVPNKEDKLMQVADSIAGYPCFRVSS